MADQEVELTSRDLENIGSLIAAFYAAFDNRGSRVPEVATLRALFIPEAHIVRVGRSGRECWTVEGFIEPRARMLTDGTLTEFSEWETECSTLGGGLIASRWSRYEKRGLLEGAELVGGGTKLIQLLRAPDAWLIGSILWEDRGALNAGSDQEE